MAGSTPTASLQHKMNVAAPEQEDGARGGAVSARGLTKRFGDLVAVDAIDLDVPRGVCYGILGPNGAGKTTLIKMIACTSPPTSGTLAVLGRDARSERRAIKAHLGIVSQEDNLDPDFTVHTNLTVFARFFRIPRVTRQKRADELLEFFQLEGKRDARIDQLSGGMKRRLVVARSLVNDPEMLILDEPTTGLDPQARHTIWARIRDLRRRGKTILLTTHYMDEAENLCDELVVIDHGKILACGTPRALIREHTGGEAVELVVEYGDEAALDRIARDLAAEGVRCERLPERIVAYGDDAELLTERHGKGDHVKETIQRRATLEDVFLRLTGRALRD